MKGALLTVCIALAAVLGIAGCGGDDETSASLTRAEYVKQGNAVCKKAQDERTKALEEAIKTAKPGEELDKAGKENLVDTALVPQYQEMAKGLDELGTPEGDEAKAEDLVEAMEKSLKDVEAEPLEAFETVKQFAKANAIAEDFGLTNCVI